MELMARNIITIALGEDINEELIELKMRKSVGGYEFETRKVKLSVAIIECFEALLRTFVGKFLNPLHLLGIIDA